MAILAAGFPVTTHMKLTNKMCLMSVANDNNLKIIIAVEVVTIIPRSHNKQPDEKCPLVHS